MNTHGCKGVRLCAPLFMSIFLAACAAPPLPEPPVDLDGDGVFEPFDQCPSTAAAALVGNDGCPGDSDGDGVPDYLDTCPDTIPGAAACAYGCELGEPIVINLVNDEFDFDKAVLKPDMIIALDNVIRMISSEDGPVDITVVGHTDNIGSEAYNQDLSLRRSKAVVDYMHANGLQDLKFEQLGKGESEPVDTNDTAQGRAKNRRVEIFTHADEQH